MNFSSSLMSGMGISLGGLELATDYLFANPDIYEPDLTEIKSTLSNKDTRAIKNIKTVKPKTTKESIISKFSLVHTKSKEILDEIIENSFVTEDMDFDAEFDTDTDNHSLEIMCTNTNTEEDIDIVEDDINIEADTEDSFEDEFDIEDNIEDSIEIEDTLGEELDIDDDIDIDIDDTIDIEDDIDSLGIEDDIDDIDIEDDIDDIDIEGDIDDIDDIDIEDDIEDIDIEDDIESSIDNINIEEEFDIEDTIEDDNTVKHKTDVETISNTNSINADNNNQKALYNNQDSSVSNIDLIESNIIKSVEAKLNNMGNTHSDEVERMRQQIANMEKQLHKLSESNNEGNKAKIDTDALDDRINRLTSSNKVNDTVDNYSSMSIEALYEEVKRYMIKLNVNRRAVELTALNKKFGDANIKKLIQKSYLIKYGKGVTIGR